MELKNKKVTKSTADQLNAYIYENREKLTQQEIAFLSGIRYSIYYEIKKPAARRNSMDFLITVHTEKVYNPEAYAKRINSISFES